MLSGNIDLDRGVTLRITGDGVEVYMYKDTPGVYLNAYGTQVSEQLALRAGFDVERLAKARKRREMMKKAALMIDEELDQDDVRTKKVIVERNGFTVTSIGLGRHIIEDPDGLKITERPLTKEEAVALFDELVPKPVEEVKSAAKAPAKTDPSKVAPSGGKAPKAE
jgi:hypothetical protein